MASAPSASQRCICSSWIVTQKRITLYRISSTNSCPASTGVSWYDFCFGFYFILYFLRYSCIAANCEIIWLLRMLLFYSCQFLTPRSMFLGFEYLGYVYCLLWDNAWSDRIKEKQITNGYFDWYGCAYFCVLFPIINFMQAGSTNFLSYGYRTYYTMAKLIAYYITFARSVNFFIYQLRLILWILQFGDFTFCALKSCSVNINLFCFGVWREYEQSRILGQRIIVHTVIISILDYRILELYGWLTWMGYHIMLSPVMPGSFEPHTVLPNV